MDCDGPPSPGSPAGASEALTHGAGVACLVHSQLMQHDCSYYECQALGHNHGQEEYDEDSSSSYPGNYCYGVPDPWTNTDTGSGGSWHTPGAVSQVDDDPVTYTPVEPAARARTRSSVPSGGAGGGQEEAQSEATFRLILVEDLLTGGGTGTSGGGGGTVSDPAMDMDASIWGDLPHELEARVLLFLPTRSQARFRCVCKRWDELLTGSRFRAQAAALAFGRGYPLCILHIPGLRTLLLSQVVPRPRLTVREVTLPGLPVPPGWASGLTRVFTHSRVPVVGAAYWGGYGELHCWLLNLAEETWRELPPLALRLAWAPQQDSRGWTIWIQPTTPVTPPGRHGHGRHGRHDGDDEFQVLLFHAPSGTLSAFSPTSGSSAAWRTGPVAEAPPVLLPPHMAAWTGLAPVPAPPPGPARFTLIVDAEGPAVFGYAVHSPPVAPAAAAAEAGSSSRRSDDDSALVSLYRLDERGGGGGRSRWECVASGLPNQPTTCTRRSAHQQLVYSCSVHKAQVVGDLVLLVVGVQQQHWGNSCHILAYHIPRGTWKWLDPPLLSDAYRCFSGQQVSFVTPTICHL